MEVEDATKASFGDLWEMEDPPQASFDDGLGETPQETPYERKTARRPTGEPTAASPEDSAPLSQGMAARNARIRKPPEKYAPGMKVKGKKYAVAMTQIAASLGTSMNAMALARCL